MAELYSLPDGWEWKTIEELCEILDRLRKPISQKDRISGEYPYYGATGIVDYINNYIFDERLLLIGEDGAKWGANENTAFIAEGKYWVNNHAHIMRPNKDLVIDSLLIYYLNTTDLMEYITGATVKKLNQEKLKSINIPLPPLEEQKRIVAKLDILFEKIDKAIALHQKNIDEADIFMASVLNDVFVELEEKSEIKRLNECFIVKDGTHDSPKYIEDGYPLFTSKNLKDYGLDTSNFNSINKEDYDNINKRSKVDKGDLLFAMIGTIGNPTIVNFEPNFAIKNVALFKPLNEESIMTYLRYYFMSEKTIIKMKNEANGATQKFVGLTYLREFPFPFIDVKTQQKVVSYLDEISNKMEKIKNLQKKKMQSLKELKASILDKAFKGEL